MFGRALRAVCSALWESRPSRQRTTQELYLSLGPSADAKQLLAEMAAAYGNHAWLSKLDTGVSRYMNLATLRAGQYGIVEKPDWIGSLVGFEDDYKATKFLTFKALQRSPYYMALLDEQIRVAFEHQMVVVPPTVDFDVKCMPDIGVIIASWGVHYALEFSVSTHFLLELLQHASRLPKMPMKQPPQIGLDGLWRAYDQARSQGSADWVRMLFADARMSTEEKIARLVMVADKTQDSLLTEFLRRPFPLPTPIAKFRPEGPLTRWVNFSVDTTLLFFILHELAHAIRMDDRYDSKSIEIFQFLRKEGVVGGRDRSVAEEHYADIFAIASVNEQHQRSLLECANFFFHLYHIRFWLSGGTRGEYPSPGERWNILSRYFGADTMKASFGEMDDYLGAFTSPLYGIDASIELQMSMFVACIEKMTTLLLNDA